MGFDRAIEHHFHGAATSRRRAAASLHQREVLRKLLSEALAPLVEVFTGRCCLQKAPTESPPCSCARSSRARTGAVLSGSVYIPAVSATYASPRGLHVKHTTDAYNCSADESDPAIRGTVSTPKLVNTYQPEVAPSQSHLIAC